MKPTPNRKWGDLRYCPVCGKRPKVTYNVLPMQCYCKVYCKPLFRKAHLVVRAGQPGEICDRAQRAAFAEWNRLVEEYYANGGVRKL